MITDLEERNIDIFCLNGIKSNIQIAIVNKMAEEIAARYGYSFSCTSQFTRRTMVADEFGPIQDIIFCKVDRERRVISLTLSSTVAGVRKVYTTCHSSMVLLIEDSACKDDKVSKIHYTVDSEAEEGLTANILQKMNRYTENRLRISYSSIYDLEYFTRRIIPRIDLSLEENKGIEYVTVVYSDNPLRGMEKEYPFQASFSGGLLVKRAYLEEILACKIEDFEDEHSKCRYESCSNVIYIGGKLITNQSLIQHADIDIRLLMAVINKVDYTIKLARYNAFAWHETVSGDLLCINVTPSFSELLERSTLNDMLLLNVFTVSLTQPSVITKYQISKENSNIKIQKV